MLRHTMVRESRHSWNGFHHAAYNVQHRNIYIAPSHLGLHFIFTRKAFQISRTAKLVISLTQYITRALQSSKVKSRLMLYICLPNSLWTNRHKTREMSFLWSGTTRLWTWRTTWTLIPAWHESRMDAQVTSLPLPTQLQIITILKHVPLVRH